MMITRKLIRTAAQSWPFFMFSCKTRAFHMNSVLTGPTQISPFTLKSNPIISSSQFRHARDKTINALSPDDSLTDIPSTSLDFAVDPFSEQGRLITSSLGISEEQHEKLSELSQLVVEWNARLNLISRKDCSVEVVFGRHVLPSVALAALPDFPVNARIVDVGTGGGFPGVPLAIIYPDSDFLLVDSVGKKLKAVTEIVSELGLENVETYHGRAEEIVDDPINARQHKNNYDICVGRSVTSLPKYCFWIKDLLKSNEGKLVYIIGGDIEGNVQSRLEADIPIDELLNCTGASDKRALILTSSSVNRIAKESGETRQKKGSGKKKSNPKNKKNRYEEGKWSDSKGSWSKKSGQEKDRGYENFKRYSS